MIKNCVICGKEFSAPPSSKKITCSKECSRKRKRISHLGVSNKWSSEAKKKKAAEGETENLKKGTPAALESPKAGPFETNVNALEWHLKGPDNREYVFRNLNKFIRDNPELFDGTFDQARAGIMAIRRSILGTRKRPVYQWKGWRIIAVNP